MSCLPSSSNKRISSSALNMAAAREVESIDDLLMDVLVRLPAKSIFRFQCISKRWNGMISSPFFCRSYYSLRRSFAHKMIAYIRENYSEADSDNSLMRRSDSVNIVPVSSRGPKLIRTKLRAKDCYYINSSNGLILFQRKPVVSYFVVNPITRREVNLARASPIFTGPPAVALVCEENVHELVLNYKVVAAGKLTEEDSYLTIYTFCSKAGEWMTSTPIATGSLNDKLNRYSSPLVVDGIIHWFTDTRSYLVVYYMESSTIQLVELPSECSENFSSRVARSSRDDDLWLCMHKAERCRIRFWMVPSEKYDSYRSRSSTVPSNAWILMHKFKYHALVPPPLMHESDDLSPAAAELALAPKEATTNGNCVYRRSRRWWRGGVRRKVPYVDFYIKNHRDSQIFNRHDFSPLMEALTLSSYAL